MNAKKAGSREKPPPAIPPGVNALMATAQVAVALSCSRRHFIRMVRRGEFPASESPPGHRPRWRTSTVNEWIETTYGRKDIP